MNDDYENLRNAGEKDQCECMEKWFRSNFEDPVLRTPTVEGEYLYLNGGPYEPHMVLGQQFADDCSENAIASSANKLSAEMHEWAPSPDGCFYEDIDHPGEEIEDTPQKAPYDDFLESIRDIEKLLSANTNADVAAISLQHRLLYAAVITALEQYLSSAILSVIENYLHLCWRLVEQCDKFKEERELLKNSGIDKEKIKKRVYDKVRYHLIWHNIKMANEIYGIVFGVYLSRYDSVQSIQEAVKSRHGIVHRNSKTLRNGEEITSEHVRKLVEEVKRFVLRIRRAKEEPIAKKPVSLMLR